jgi:hypothetical protein
MDEETLREIRQVAASERLARLRLLALLDDLDHRHGAPSEALRAEVDTDLRACFGTMA